MTNHIPIEAQRLVKPVLIYLTLFTAAMNVCHHILPDTKLRERSLQRLERRGFPAESHVLVLQFV